MTKKQLERLLKKALSKPIKRELIRAALLRKAREQKKKGGRGDHRENARKS